MIRVQWHYYCAKSKIHKTPFRMTEAGSRISKIKRHFFLSEIQDPWGLATVLAQQDPRSLKSRGRNENTESQFP